MKKEIAKQILNWIFYTSMVGFIISFILKLWIDQDAILNSSMITCIILFFASLFIYGIEFHEPKKIKAEDIFEKDIFKGVKETAEKTLKTLNELETQMKMFLNPDEPEKEFYIFRETTFGGENKFEHHYLEPFKSLESALAAIRDAKRVNTDNKFVIFSTTKSS